MRGKEGKVDRKADKDGREGKKKERDNDRDITFSYLFIICITYHYRNHNIGMPISERSNLAIWVKMLLIKSR